MDATDYYWWCKLSGRKCLRHKHCIAPPANPCPPHRTPVQRHRCYFLLQFSTVSKRGFNFLQVAMKKRGVEAASVAVAGLGGRAAWTRGESCHALMDKGVAALALSCVSHQFLPTSAEKELFLVQETLVLHSLLLMNDDDLFSILLDAPGLMCCLSPFGRTSSANRCSRNLRLVGMPFLSREKEYRQRLA